MEANLDSILSRFESNLEVVETAYCRSQGDWGDLAWCVSALSARLRDKQFLEIVYRETFYSMSVMSYYYLFVKGSTKAQDFQLGSVHFKKNILTILRELTNHRRSSREQILTHVNSLVGLVRDSNIRGDGRGWTDLRFRLIRMIIILAVVERYTTMAMFCDFMLGG